MIYLHCLVLNGHAPQQSNLWRLESKHFKLGFPIKSSHATVPFLKIKRKEASFSRVKLALKWKWISSMYTWTLCIKHIHNIPQKQNKDSI